MQGNPLFTAVVPAAYGIQRPRTAAAAAAEHEGGRR